jgi:hypothetical protein
VFAGSQFWNSYNGSSSHLATRTDLHHNIIGGGNCRAVAIAAAPIAAAAPAALGDPSQLQQSCAHLDLGAAQSECQTPGNVQVNDAPPQVDYFPYSGGAA